MNPQPSRTIVDGIPVNWIDAGEPKMSVILSFGVGYRDEQPHTVGLSHLVEHLVMRGASQLTIPHNATTDPDSLQFYAVGDPQQIVDFVAMVSAGVHGLRALPEEVVNAEKRIVAAELGPRGSANIDGPYRRIFGLSGVGLSEYGQPALNTFTSAMVAQFAERWLHSANVLVTLSGPVPENLRISLPHGAKIERRPHTPPVLREFPCWIAVDGAPVSLTVVTAAPWGAKALAAQVLERALFDKLRTDLGLIYSTQTWATRLDTVNSSIRFSLDPRDEHAERVMIESTRLVRELASRGIAQAYIDGARQKMLDSMDSPEAGVAWLIAQAPNLARGWPSMALAEARGALISVSAVDLQSVWAEFARTLVLSTQVDSISNETFRQLNLAAPRWTPHPVNLGVRGVFSDVMSGTVMLLDPVRGEPGLKGHQLHVTPQHLTVLDAMNDVSMQVAIDDVRLVRRYQNGVLGFDFSTGLTAWIKPSAWKDPKNFIGSALDRIPRNFFVSVG
jgi:hypothetical protein